MPTLALALLLISAALHASWNLLVKRAVEKQVFTWLALVAGSLVFLPVLAFNPAPPGHIWPYIIVSAIVELAYYLALTRAYQEGDFSLIYPIARGAAPALLAIWAVLFLNERPSTGGLIGMGLLIGGLVVVGSSTWWASHTSVTPGRRSIITALVIAVFISIYSAIDAAAVRMYAPAPYTVLVLAIGALMGTPLMLKYYSTQVILTEWRASWPRIVAVGVLTMITYTLVLQAYAIAHVSYAAATREISIVFAALIGWRWLGESFGPLRTAGAALIFLGILVIALLG